MFSAILDPSRLEVLMWGVCAVRGAVLGDIVQLFRRPKGLAGSGHPQVIKIHMELDKINN